MTSAIIGASSVAQLESNVAALSAPALTPDELDTIDGILAGHSSR
jgi:L-glyceraldehyde 3-phosphate reductase